MTAVTDNGDMADEREMTEPGGPSIEADAAAEAVAAVAAAEAVVAAEAAEVAEVAEAERKPRARDLNELIRYTMWSVFRVADRAGLESGGLGNAAAEVNDLLEQAAGKGIVTRGCYDLQGLRAGADYMFWWVASDPDDLQDLFTRFRRIRRTRNASREHAT